jgi:shikimate dehydrogenase
MHPDVEAAPVTEPEFYEKLGAAFDVIYTPVETKFMKLAAAAGARTSNGLDMLLYQGIAAYELWYPEVKIPEPVIDGARELLSRFLGGDA